MNGATSCLILLIAIGLGSAARIEKRESLTVNCSSFTGRCKDRNVEVTDGKDLILRFPETVNGFNYVTSRPYVGDVLALPEEGETSIDHRVAVVYVDVKKMEKCKCEFTLTISVPATEEKRGEWLF